MPHEDREALRRLVAYSGNAAHKRNPGDFGLTPPASPRPDKTLCDRAGVFEKAVAQRLLETGIMRGLVSLRFTGPFPQNIWAVGDGGEAFEAQLENHERGTYHGYPMPESDPLTDQVLEWWRLEDV